MDDTAVSLQTPLRVGTVTLAVHDLPRVADFYRDVLGLRDVTADAERADLGVDDAVLLRLVRSAMPAATRIGVGLFHTAFLLPTRADLGRWLRHAAAIGLPLDGMSDHGVSEAVYLQDPEGNGIEIYADRPTADWPRTNGALQMVTERLHVADVTEVAGDTPWLSAPSGTRIGHVHLAVGSVEESEAFYRTVIGFDRMVRLPAASFLSSGGYHHHVAVNAWHTGGLSPRAPSGTGLRCYELVTDDASVRQAIARRAAQANAALESTSGALTLRDPSGIEIRVVGPS